ncbi:MAG: 2-hydroxyhepta-2,4-diene-1,7-dioate isomerase [Verrucomicrobiales bacterium]|nr:2-hydroxyhepta-2,4-diene-1,7-dioate isomerase [Verrucomicrobiales bacterium]
MPYRIFRSHQSIFIESSEAPGLFRHVSESFSFNDLFTSEDPVGYIESIYSDASEGESFDPEIPYQPPIGDQEVWAAGVTYFRSRTARMEEAESAGGDIFYDKVYDADRPELFFKATAPRTRGHLDNVAIRSDSTWDVPEPELTLAITDSGKVFGFTIGNDMSSRSIEGENPLYLPQAKVYTGSCSIGPCLVVGDAPGPDTTIAIEISRGGEVVFSGDTTVSQIKRGFDELAGFLFRSNEYKHGAYLMTGTGIVPDSDFTLQPGDVISISIEGAGTLTNTVEKI